MKLLVTALFLALLTLPVPAAAGTLSIDVGGVLGPVLQGSDPINLTGETFMATGAIDPNAVPVSISGDSATYDLSGNLQLMLGAVTLTEYDATLTITAPPSGPDTLALDFSVTEFNFTPQVEASFSLPSGTLNGTGIQRFWAEVSQPDSSFSFVLPDSEIDISGTLGITGSASIGGTPSSNAPEPGTVNLLAAGLVLGAIAMKLKVPGK
jgi:hypothetical protein